MALIGIGLPIDQNTVRAEAGQAALELHRALQRCSRFKAKLDGIIDADLVSLGFLQADVDTLRSAYGDAAQLDSIAHGNQALASAKDFFTFLDRLTGVK